MDASAGDHVAAVTGVAWNWTVAAEIAPVSSPTPEAGIHRAGHGSQPGSTYAQTPAAESRTTLPWNLGEAYAAEALRPPDRPAWQETFGSQIMLPVRGPTAH